MDTEMLWNGVTLAAFGGVMALIGVHLRKEYRRLFVGSSRFTESTGPSAPFAAYLGYIASFLFAAALAFFASAAYTFFTELWRFITR